MNRHILNNLSMKVFLISFPSLLVSFCYSQVQTKPINPAHIIKVKIPADSTPKALRINIAALAIIDARDDTSNIGYAPNEIFEAKNYVLSPSLNEQLSTWFTNYLRIDPRNKTGTTLLVNIRKLRLSDQAMPRIGMNGRITQGNNGWESGIITKIEYYLMRDSLYTPLYRYDSIIPLRDKLKKHYEDFMQAALEFSLEKLFTLNLDIELTRKRKILLSDILNANKSNLGKPVYNSTVFPKGLYRNFEDFVNCKPFIEEFEFKTGELGDMVYVNENGEKNAIRDVWGYSDGTSFYINSGGIYSKLIRTGNTFYFAGVKSISRKVSHYMPQTSLFNLATGTGIKDTDFRKEIRYFQLDMETGDIY